MKPEELLKTLREGGMDDPTLQKLLSDTLALLKGDNSNDDAKEEVEEKAEAARLLGVTL